MRPDSTSSNAPSLVRYKVASQDSSLTEDNLHPGGRKHREAYSTSNQRAVEMPEEEFRRQTEVPGSTGRKG